MDKNINTVWSSRDYTKFKLIAGNRAVNRAKVESLMESIEKNPLAKPIDVNENFEIIDGQHRLEAWRELGMPVIFIVHPGWGLIQVPILNSNQNNWKTTNFVDSFIQQGKKEYEVYQEFADRWGFGPGVNIMLLCGGDVSAGGGGKTKKNLDKFRSGDFRVTSLTFANETARKVTDFKPHYDGYKGRTFVAAMTRLFKKTAYDHKVMLTKVSYQSQKIKPCTTIDLYYDMMKDIYNYKNQGGVPRL